MEVVISSDRFQRTNTQVSVTIDGEEVILTLDDGVYYALNNTAQCVWKELEQLRSVDELVGAILDEYEVEADVARASLVALLDDLDRYGLIVRVAAAS